MSYPYRCTHKISGRGKYKSEELYIKAKANLCGYRVTLEYREHYVKCPKCNREMREDKSRKPYTKKENCNCGGVYGSTLTGKWPHRKGCLGCEHYAGPINLEQESGGYYENRID